MILRMHSEGAAVIASSVLAATALLYGTYDFSALRDMRPNGRIVTGYAAFPPMSFFRRIFGSEPQQGTSSPTPSRPLDLDARSAGTKFIELAVTLSDLLFLPADARFRSSPVSDAERFEALCATKGALFNAAGGTSIGPMLIKSNSVNPFAKGRQGQIQDLSLLSRNRMMFYAKELKELSSAPTYLAMSAVYLINKNPLGDPSISIEEMLAGHPDLVPISMLYRRLLWLGQQEALKKSCLVFEQLAHDHIVSGE